MKLTKERKFLYSRIALLIFTAGWILSAVAGFKGFTFWYGGFAVCLWGTLGILNLRHKSSLWLLLNRSWKFLLLYGVLVGISVLVDRFGQNLNLWFYPVFRGTGFWWTYPAFFSFGGLAMIELLYFLSGFWGKELKFEEQPKTFWHGFFDSAEHILFLTLLGVIVLGATGWFLMAFSSMLLVATLWLIVMLIKTRFHVRNNGQYILIILLAVVIGISLQGMPNILAREWTYLETPFLNTLILGFPVRVWVGWYLYFLVPLRLWISLVLHAKKR